uniref:FXNA-like protease n=1 Tax=Cacopsylla melanoneura TaxID=428564 RepID=A0A8D8VNW2_9HEMI
MISSGSKSIRQRSGGTKIKSPPEDVVYSSKLSSPRRSQPSSVLAPTYMFGLFVLVYLATYGFVMLVERQLPRPLTIQDEPRHPGRFIAERVYNHLVNLTSLGPRPVGSFENEVLAVNFLRKEINNVIQQSDPKVHQIRLDTQTVSGAFPLTFLDRMTNIYRNVQNVIVRVGPVVESAHSLLVNCHFDTVPDSPGASDDGSSCALMLELLRVIALSPTPLQNNIVFLFNGAEEAFLQASHGFITQHPWARNVRAFVNLEACGAGGREVLFQSGPKNPWLMEVYSASVPYPFASSLAQDVFQSGLIPGDTDFRIFRDFGNIPGLDFAWSKNGYVYHTRLDAVSQIPLASLQRTGDNILPLLLNLVNSKQLVAVHQYREGSLVYFDFIGLFIVTLSSTFTILVCLLTLGLVLLSVYINSRAAGEQLAHGSSYAGLLVRCAGFTLVNYLLCLGVNLAIAFTLTKMNRAMSWYGAHLWLVPLYIIPLLILSFSSILFFTHNYLAKFTRFKQSTHSSFYYNVITDSTLLLYSLIMMLLMFTYVGSVMVPLIWILSLSLFSILRSLHPSLSLNPVSSLLCFLLFSLVPYMLCSYLIYCVLLLIVPIMGRSGSGNHAEEVISFLTTTIFSLLFNLMTPCILFVRSPKKVLSSLGTIFFVSILLLVLTPLGFPYSGELSSPTPQRYMIMHVDRVYHNPYSIPDQLSVNSSSTQGQGSIRKAKSGLWLIDLDVNSPKTIDHLISEGSMSVVSEDSDCSRELYCGLPYFLPVYTFIFHTHWIQDRVYTPLGVPLDLKLTYKHVEPWNQVDQSNNTQPPVNMSPTRKGTRIRLSFSLNGTDHVNILVSPFTGVELVRWSLLEGTPLKNKSKFRGRDTYFVFYTCASNIQSFHFWIELFVEEATTGHLVDMGVASHHVHGEKQLTKPLASFLNKFPSWTVTTGWTAGMKLYTF